MRHTFIGYSAFDEFALILNPRLWPVPDRR